MKGIILAGGTGSRLSPCTNVTNKHLLPVYKKPMIFYPLDTLKNAGIEEILLVTGAEHAGDFANLLRSGEEYGVRITYKVQDKPGGIAQALSLAEDFVGDSLLAVILGDNIYEDNFSEDISSFSQGAKVFLKEVPDAHRFGVPEIEGNRVTKIFEKPEIPPTNYAVTGLYLYDNGVFAIIRTLEPSKRGELEITDVNNDYIKMGEMQHAFVNGYWSDAGTHESLFRASQLVRERERSK